MSRLSPIKAKRLIPILKKLGFTETHRKGSHRFFEHPDGRTTVVADHGSEEIGRGLLRAILNQIQISPLKFQKLLRK